MASDATSGTLTMVRLDDVSYDPWAVFHCFELRITNPYKFPASNKFYRPFNIADKPICTSLDPNVKVKCRYRSNFILQFWFESLSD